MAKTGKILPRLNRIDFFRLHSEEFFEKLFSCMDLELGEGPQYEKKWAMLNPFQQGIYAWRHFGAEVQNGGLAQFFYNFREVLAPSLEKLFKEIENEKMVALLKQAVKIYRKHKKEFAVENPFGTDGLFARMNELEKLDHHVVLQLGRTGKLLEKWVRANISRIALGDSDEPIDPNFSGELETCHPNGKVFEQATIKRGKLSGPYRRYFDDGALEHSCFYQSGEVSTDCWPDGRSKCKTMKRGKLKIKEWYYPSGNLQKRFVSDKSGYAVEPVRLWHENGQLAEEVHVKNSDRFGPWRRFFEDGSPRLVAEFRRDETLVVKNAWNERRKQVVKNGRGVYFDDGLDINAEYSLISQADWTSSRELRDGIPHGKSTVWSDGVLWSKEEYVKGKRHGRSDVYYDNGRLRTQSIYRNGEEIERKKFPKYENPKPVVLICVNANAELYEDWGHPLLDVYPTPRNLKQVQRKLKIPDFLQEKFDHYKAGKASDGFEDISGFDDGVSYMAIVNERGIVEKIDFWAYTAFSGSTVDIYPAILQKLKFQPGILKGRKVCCQINVEVRHTFAEADSHK